MTLFVWIVLIALFGGKLSMSLLKIFSHLKLTFGNIKHLSRNVQPQLRERKTSSWRGKKKPPGNRKQPSGKKKHPGNKTFIKQKPGAHIPP